MVNLNDLKLESLKKMNFKELDVLSDTIRKEIIE